MAISQTQKAEFLKYLSLGETVKSACGQANISRRAIYYLKEEDPEFAGAWEASIAEGTESLVDEARKLALDRTYKNNHILLMFLIKKRDPSFRDNYRTETTIKHESVREFHFSEKEVNKALEILEAQKAKAAPSEPIPESAEVASESKDKATPPADA